MANYLNTKKVSLQRQDDAVMHEYISGKMNASNSFFVCL